jgi:two-component system cell cycle response regulator CpdR
LTIGALPGKVIHLIDDEPDIVSIAAAALQDSGYAVHSFTDPAKALEDIEVKCREKMGMLITDIRMPGYSGFDIARKARSIVPDLPVVFMTAFEINQPEFEKMFPSLKVDEFLQKPFRVNRLLQVVRQHVM